MHAKLTSSETIREETTFYCGFTPSRVFRIKVIIIIEAIAFITTRGEKKIRPIIQFD